MKKLILFVTLAACTNIFGQKKINFDNEFRYADNAGCNYALVFYNDSGLRLDFYNCFDQIKYTRNYSIKYNPKKMDAKGTMLINESEYSDEGNIKKESSYNEGSKNGVEIEFYKNGIIKSKRNFHNWKIHGLELNFDENGIQKDSNRYNFGKLLNGMIIKSYTNQFKGLHYYLNGNKVKSIILNSNNDTSSIYNYKIESGQSYLYNCSYYSNNKIDTTFKAKTAHAILSNKLKAQVDTISFNSKNIIETRFIGGEPHFFDLLDDNLIYPLLMKTKGITGVVAIIFTLSREGIVLELGSNSLVNQDFKTEAIRVMELSSGKWHPTMNNENYSINNYRIEITFMLESE